MTFQVTHSNAFTQQIIDRAEALHAQGLEEGVLDQDTFGELMVYIDRKPKSVLTALDVTEGPLAGRTVYCGGEEP